MAYEETRASGGLWVNNNKKSDNHPDYNGHVTVDREILTSLVDQMKAGVKFPKIEIASWKKVSGQGATWLSIAPKVPWELTEKGKAHKAAKQGNSPSDGGFPDLPPVKNLEDLDDDLPF